ncbi:MAG: STY0301 family protein [Acidobacteriota bacterium]
MRALILLIGTCFAVVTTQAEEVRCPAAIDLKKPELAKEASGWKPVLAAGAHEVTNVTVYDGPIEEKASLVPDGDRKVGKKVQEFWKLDAKNPRGYWLQCHYAATPLTLIKAVPKGATSCVVTADPGLKREGMAVVESAVCK